MATTAKSKRGYKVLASRTVGGEQLLTVRVRRVNQVDVFTVLAEYDGFGLSCQWAHLTDPARCYTCVVSHTGQALSCDCVSRRRCRHMDLTEVLIRTGELAIPG